MNSNTWHTNIITNITTVTGLISLFFIVFTLGGTTGILLGNSAVDLILHDSYYIVGHFHLVLSLGTVLSILLTILTTISWYTNTSNICTTITILSLPTITT
jgi:heme/copper-type cytochrome/quinol oxidase subunit 1